MKGCLLEFDLISIMDSPEVETYHHLSDKSRELGEQALPRSHYCHPFHVTSIKSPSTSPDHVMYLGLFW